MKLIICLLVVVLSTVQSKPSLGLAADILGNVAGKGEGCVDLVKGTAGGLGHVSEKVPLKKLGGIKDQLGGLGGTDVVGGLGDVSEKVPLKKLGGIKDGLGGKVGDVGDHGIGGHDKLISTFENGKKTAQSFNNFKDIEDNRYSESLKKTKSNINESTDEGFRSQTSETIEKNKDSSSLRDIEQSHGSEIEESYEQGLY